MSSGSPLNAWRFLVGTWKGSAESQFGEKGIVESVAVFSLEPSEKFIMATGKSRCEERLLNKSTSILFYDNGEGKFRRKTFFSYGFVSNETEYARSKDAIKFEVKMEPLPKQFEGIRWRSYLRKISDKQVAMGLEMAQPGEEFKSYGETVLTKIS